MLTLIIDADSAGYQFACRNTHSYDWGDGIASTMEHEAQAKDELRTHFEELREDFGADHVILALSDYERPCFRKAIYPEYKKSRHEKPKLLYTLRQFMQDAYDTYIRPTLEADDIVGILATHPTLVRGDKVVVSVDKDLRAIPCRLYNPQSAKYEEIDEFAADAFFFQQVLTGDPVDEYPGCPGIGPKRAAKVLANFGSVPNEEIWKAIVEAYRSKGLTEEDALVQARLARILRYTDYDFKRKKPKLWTPPKLNPSKAA